MTPQFEQRLRVLAGLLVIGTPVFLSSGLESIWAAVVAIALIVGIVVLVTFGFWPLRSQVPKAVMVLLAGSGGIVIVRLAQAAI